MTKSELGVRERRESDFMDVHSMTDAQHLQSLSEAFHALEEASHEVACAGAQEQLSCILELRDQVHNALTSHLSTGLSEYSGLLNADLRSHLRPIGQLLGVRPGECFAGGRSWRDEWVPLMIEWLNANGYSSLANPEYGSRARRQTHGPSAAAAAPDPPRISRTHARPSARMLARTPCLAYGRAHPTRLRSVPQSRRITACRRM